MRWVGVPDDAIVYVTTKPLYPAVGGPDELTDVLDHWVDTHPTTTVIEQLDNNQA